MGPYLFHVFLLQWVLIAARPNDSCDQCSKGILQCERISGIYTVTRLSQGYHPIIDVPAGACSVNITELRHSRNYLAVKSKNGHWILNGHFLASNPGVYHGAGTRFQYSRGSRQCRTECIWTRGPLNKDITIQLLYIWTGNKGITYEYLLPPNVPHAPINQLLYQGRQIHRRRHHHHHHHHGSSSSHISHKVKQSPPNTPSIPKHITSKPTKQALPNTPSPTQSVTPFVLEHTPAPTSLVQQTPSPTEPTSSSTQPLTTNGNLNRYQTTSQLNDISIRNPVKSTTDPASATIAGSIENSKQSDFNRNVNLNLPKTYTKNVQQNNYNSPRIRDPHGVTYLRHVQKPHYISARVDRPLTRFHSQNYHRARYNYHPLETRYQELKSSNTGVRRGNLEELEAQGINLKEGKEQTGPVASEVTIGRVETSESYDWSISGFTECSHQCGGGTQETQVVCVLKNTQVSVTDNNCDVSSKPAPQTVDCNTAPCPAKWVIHDWSECSVTCGRGTQTRRVECKRRISAETQISVSASVCGNEEKPSIVQQCENDPCTRWNVGPWGQCSTECGRGQKQRTILCVNQANITVTDSKCTQIKPRTSEPCNLGPCDYYWFYSDWSNECSKTCEVGYMTRSLHCATMNGEPTNDRNCDVTKKPESLQQCRSTPNCGSVWFVGPWSQCSVSCGTGVRSRYISCLSVQSSENIYPDNQCDNADRPVTEETCEQPSCGVQWHMSDWTQCSVTCGDGISTRNILCLDQDKSPSNECSMSPRPVSKKKCNKKPCVTRVADSDPNCRDTYRHCRLVVQARLCGYSYYNKICCAACTKNRKH